MGENNPENFEVAENQSKKTKEKNWRALVAYWILGLSNNYGYVVMLSAASDILGKQGEVDPSKLSVLPRTNPERDCNYISTGAILLADILPCLLIKLIAPFLPFFINIRVAICVILAIAGFLLVAFSESQWMAITGVVLTSCCSGLGEVSYLQYSSFYDKNVISTWSSGTGAAGVIGALSYTGLSYLGLRTALLIMLIVPIIMALTFWILLTKPEESQSIVLQRTINENEVGDPKAAFRKKLKILPSLMKYMIPLGLVYFFEYFINQGTFELINFDGIFIDKSQQYKWLQVDYQVGVFISRSSVNFFKINKIWILAVLQFINVFIFTFEAIYYYMPSIWLVLAFTLWEGLLGGGIYVNTFYRISTEVPEENKQFSMSTTSFADSIGITLAGLFAILAHNKICDLPKPTRLGY